MAKALIFQLTSQIFPAVSSTIYSRELAGAEEGGEEDEPTLNLQTPFWPVGKIWKSIPYISLTFPYYFGSSSFSIFASTMLATTRPTPRQSSSWGAPGCISRSPQLVATWEDKERSSPTTWCFISRRKWLQNPIIAAYPIYIQLCSLWEFNLANYG